MKLDITLNSRWKLIFWACLMVVLLLSLLPGGPNMPTTGWDKTNHLIAFSVLTILGFYAYPGRSAAVLFGLILYGGLIEIFQSFTSYRFAEMYDLFADSLGIIVGWGLHTIISRSGRAGYSD